ncbi:MAG: tetratricopeptide repeat protein [Pyrinomonadaceae bacterium]|nr:tetratricopeptide repeat protein [Pyrinomonadaceae bacterium]
MLGQTVSHYRIMELLGEGGMGAVYAAEDTLLHRRVAVKFPSRTPDEHGWRTRFLREARLVSSLNHPYIAAIYDYGETSDGRPFIVMELVPGETLHALLIKGELTVARSLKIIEDVAEALGEAHSRGIVHRDVKPSNIIVDARSRVKVLDFGLSKQLAGDRLATINLDAETIVGTRTASGVILGTPLYLSPEQAKSADVDARSDLFALGALLYECVAGRSPFSGSNTLEIIAQVIHFDPPPPSQFNPDVPPELDRITLRALAKNPTDRYQTSDELLADLRAIHANSDFADRRHTPRPTSQAATTLATASASPSLSPSLSYALQRPRLSIAMLVFILLIAFAGVWTLARWRGVREMHQPAPEAEVWYKRGADSLRDGAYYGASKSFERAVEIDNKFALAHARLAEVLMEMDNTERAKDELLQVSELVPERTALPQQDALYLDAIMAVALRNYEQAIEAYRKIASLSPDDAQVHVDLGRAYEKTDRINDAIASYSEATRRNAEYATAYLRLGVLYGRQRDLARADSNFTRADALYQAAGNVEGRTEVFYQRGSLYDRIGKVKEAGAFLQQALEMARATNNRYQEIGARLQLSGVQYDAGNPAEAEAHARQAVALARTNGMDGMVAHGLVALGNFFFARGVLSEAESYYRQAIETARQHKALRNEARARVNLGSLLIQRSETDAGVEEVEQALAFYRQGGYGKETSQALLLLARTNRQRGNYAAALQAFEQQLQLAEQVGDESQAATAHSSIGNVLAAQERYTQALDHFDASYMIYKSLGDQPNTAFGSMNRGYVLWQLGRYEEAHAALREASAIAEQSNNHGELSAWIYLVKARIELSAQHYSEAKKMSRQALLLSGTQYKSVIIEAKRALGLSEALSGKPREGEKLCKEAVEVAAQVNDPLMFSNALLTLADVLLISGDAENARTKALQAQAGFARTGQQDSDWRAWLIAARASHLAGNETTAREYAARANDSLSNFQQILGAESFNSYLSRPDIQRARQQLSEMLAVNE